MPRGRPSKYKTEEERRKARYKRSLAWKQTKKGKAAVARANRKSRLKDRFGITLKQYDILFESQNGRCAICLKEETRIVCGKVAKLSVDHDHETGRVRALLCHKCNAGLGLFNDSLGLVLAAVDYLEHHASLE